MRILIATGIYPPSIGGPATYSELLFNELKNYGIEPFVLSFDEVRHLPKVIRHIAYFFRVIRLGRAVDLIYAQDPVSVGLPAWLGARILGKRFYLKVVGDYAWEQGTQRYGVTDSIDEFNERKDGFGTRVGMMKYIQMQVASRADAVVVPSNYLKTIVMKWGVAAEKIKVIYNAFEGIEEVKEEKAMIKAALEMSRMAIISAGRLVPWKGFEMLIEILPDLIPAFPDLILYIAGEGPDKEKLIKKAISMNVSDKVVFMGKVERSKLGAYLKAADIFVLNTSYEGMSHQLLEVLAIGTPIITTNVGGNPEVITHDREGVLVPFNNKEALIEGITRILTDKIYADGLIKNGRNKVAGFSKEKMLTELADAFVQHESTVGPHNQ